MDWLLATSAFDKVARRPSNEIYTALWKFRHEDPDG